MKNRRIREKGERSLKFTAYLVTMVCVILPLLPLGWMFSTSLKDNGSVYQFPPSLLPKMPQTITITLDYTGLEEQTPKDYELDAMKATWFPWKIFQNEPVGEVRVIGVIDQQVVYEAKTPSYLFHAGRPKVLPTQLFSNELMEQKLPFIKEAGYSDFQIIAEGGLMEITAGNSEKAISTQFSDYLKSSEYITGQLVSVDQNKNIWRLFDNYLSLFKLSGDSQLNFLRYFSNSMVVTLTAIVLQLILGGIAGYALSHLFSRRWSVWLTFFFVATLMISDNAIIVPLFLIITELHLVNTLWGIILPHTAWGLSIFLFKGFFDQLPGELIQAARIDGSSELRTFGRIVIPMSIPIFTVVGVMAFIPLWNEFLWPLIVARKQEVWTFTVALNALQYNTSPTILITSSLLSAIPLLMVFIFCQGLIEKGASWTGIKG
ncbi:MAG TPA: carbohydrate ABC transporter permease [Bacilli bacterium]